MSIVSDSVEDGAILSVKAPTGDVVVQYLEAEPTLYPEAYLLSPLHKVSEDQDQNVFPFVQFNGNTWRRSPFAVRCPLFRRDFEVDGIEIVGRAKSPPQKFRKWVRFPTDVVDFLTGSGPWRITGPGQSHLVTWLSSDSVRIPYIVNCFPGGLGSFNDHPDTDWEYQINDRSIEFGRERERQGLKPAKLYNDVLDKPRYPELSSRQVRMRVGDLIEIPTLHGFAYLQVTPYEYQSYGKLLRVFEGYWKQRPAKFGADLFRTKYLLCCPFIKDALEDGKFQIAERIDLVEDTGKRPTMRSEPMEEDGKYLCILHEEGSDPDVVTFGKEQLSLSTTVGNSIPDLVEFLDLDWRPEIDLWSKIALMRNEERSAER